MEGKDKKENDIFSSLKKQREKILNDWESSGLLDGLGEYKPKKNLALLLDDAPTAKINVAELMECEASKLLKKEFLNLDELNDYLRMLADMDNIGIRRKLVLLEGYINKVKREINNGGHQNSTPQK